jgi:intracellular sulfur oxidation DsrE/DsrF family protein
MLWTNNYFTASRGAAYGLTDADSSVVICLRHESAPFAFTDAMWAKYGPALSEHAAFSDPKTKQPATVNVFQASGYGVLLSNRGTTLDTLIGHGVRFAVCMLATRGIAGQAARVTGGKVDDIYKELTENKIANAHMVPAGIVAVNRAQERGFSMSSVS